MKKRPAFERAFPLPVTNEMIHRVAIKFSIERAIPNSKHEIMDKAVSV